MSLLNYQLKNEGSIGQINCLQQTPQKSITNQWNLKMYETDEYLVQFCSDWKILHLENQLVIVREFLQGLQSFTIDLQVLYKQQLKQKVYSHIYSRTFLNKDYHILIIVGINKLFVFDIQLFETSFSVQLRTSENIQLDYCKIYETDETVYLLTNTCRVYEIRYLNTQNIQISKADYHYRKSGFLNSFIPQKGSHKVEEEGFVGYLLLQEQNDRKLNMLIIAQAISKNQIKLLVCQWPTLEQLCEPYVLQDETMSQACNYELSNMQFGLIDGQLYLFIVSYRQHTQLQVFINRCKIFIADEIVAIQEFKNLNQLMNNNNSSFKSDILIMNNEFHILYSYNDCYYYHNNNFEEFQRIESSIYGFGRSIRNVMIATEDSFKILKQYADYQLRNFIKPSLMRCQNKNIRNILIDGFNKFAQGQKSTLQTKLQLQGFHCDEVNGSANQITYDIMESPLSHYETESNQLKQRLNKIYEWKQFLKQIETPQEIMINVVEAEIFLKIGEYILQNQEDFDDPINSSLEHWEMGQHYKSQFFSKLLELEYFLSECIKLNTLNIVEKLFHYIYRVVWEQRTKEGMEHCQFWVQSNTWIQMMRSIFNQKEKTLLFDLYDAFLCDLSICMRFMTEQSQKEFEQIIMEVSESMLDLDQEIDILPILEDKNLFKIIFRLYIEKHNRSSVILQYLFQLFQKLDPQNVLCNDFIQRVVNFEKQTMQTNQGTLINFIFDQIDINNEDIQHRIYEALQNYPKLQFYFGIRIQSVLNINQLAVPLNKVQNNSEFVYLREQAYKLY